MNDTVRIPIAMEFSFDNKTGLMTTKSATYGDVKIDYLVALFQKVKNRMEAKQGGQAQ